MRKTIIVTNNIISEIDMIPASKAICIQYVFSQGRANRIVTLACYVVSFAERVNCKVHPSKGLLLVLESKYEKRFRLKSFQTPFVSLVSLFETKVQKMTAVLQPFISNTIFKSLIMHCQRGKSKCHVLGSMQKYVLIAPYSLFNKVIFI